jgi:hypothetical protein
MQLVTDSKVSIELIEILTGTKFVPDGKKVADVNPIRQMEPVILMITNELVNFGYID